MADTKSRPADAFHLELASIPHRAPFLFVDEILEYADRRIVTSWNADPSAPFFAGHYPGRPIMPGVLLCECCFQAGALLIAGRLGGYDETRSVPVVTRIQDARFKRMVRPGEKLRIEVTIDEILDDAFYLTGRITVDGEPAVRVTFACMQSGAAS